MKNRMGILLLVLCLLLSAFPVHAAPETEAGQVCQDMIDDYRDILKNTNMASLQGYCGLMASWQLYFLGVNDWVMSHHGKDQYDAYYDAAVTSGGHSVKAYSAANYTLEEALNQNSLFYWKGGMTKRLCEKFATMYGAKHCVYGHLHAHGIASGFRGEKNGVNYHLVSCDALGFAPVLIDTF